MASPALAVLAAFASRRSLFFFRARVFLPDLALEGWMVCVRRCTSRGRGVREKRFFAWNEKSSDFQRLLGLDGFA
jgi:hypothetical protein